MRALLWGLKQPLPILLDGKTFPKLWGDLDLAGFLEWIDQTYGDNADYTPENIALVTQAGKQPCFHSKAETGKHPKTSPPSSAKIVETFQN